MVPLPRFTPYSIYTYIYITKEIRKEIINLNKFSGHSREKYTQHLRKFWCRVVTALILTPQGPKINTYTPTSNVTRNE